MAPPYENPTRLRAATALLPSQSPRVPAEREKRQFSAFVRQYLRKLSMTGSGAGMGRYQSPCRSPDLCLGPCTRGGQEGTRSASVPPLPSFHPGVWGPNILSCDILTLLSLHSSWCWRAGLPWDSLFTCLPKAKLTPPWCSEGTAQVSSLSSVGTTHRGGCPCKLSVASQGYGHLHETVCASERGRDERTKRKDSAARVLETGKRNSSVFLINNSVRKAFPPWPEGGGDESPALLQHQVIPVLP